MLEGTADDGLERMSASSTTTTRRIASSLYRRARSQQSDAN
jgi:hypothetical protein